MRLGKLARPLGGAAAILVAAVTGCSTPGSGTANAACNTPGVTPDQVNLGFVVSDSGPGSSTYSSARSGVDARIGLANEEGGVGGRQIVYQWRDDESSPSVNAQVTEDLVQREAVFGLMTSSAVVGGSMDSLTELGVPVTGIATEPAWAEHQNMFSATYSVSRKVIGRYIQASGGTKVAIVVQAGSAPGTAVAAQIVADLQAVGVSAVATISYSTEGDSPDRIARQIIDADADALIGVIAPTDLAGVLQVTRAAGHEFVASIMLGGYDRRLLAAAGPALAGVSFPVTFRPFEAGGPPIERYRDAMIRFAPQTFPPEQQFALLAYIYTDLFLRGLELAGPCPTREGFITALRQVPDYDAGGLVEPVDFGSNIGKPTECHAFVRINPAGTEFEVARERLCADGTGS